MEATRSSEMSVYNEPTWHQIPDDILHVYAVLACMFSEHLPDGIVLGSFCTTMSYVLLVRGTAMQTQ
jgi:hypothetical protein